MIDKTFMNIRSVMRRSMSMAMNQQKEQEERERIKRLYTPKGGE